MPQNKPEVMTEIKTPFSQIVPNGRWWQREGGRVYWTHGNRPEFDRHCKVPTVGAFEVDMTARRIIFTEGEDHDDAAVWVMLNTDDAVVMLQTLGFDVKPLPRPVYPAPELTWVKPLHMAGGRYSKR